MRTRSTDGVLLVDKPAGASSHDVVLAARRALAEPRVGHAGTLDPFATGLLVLLLGRATRLLPYLDAEPKVYDATIRFGAETDTDDLLGAPSRSAEPPEPDAVLAAIPRLTGHIEQRPPAYSAKRVGGRRAYVAARAGEPLDLAPVPVVVHDWSVRAWRGAEMDVTISCGGGTYIRALARDLGRLVESAAHLSALRRTRSGVFDLGGAITLEDLQRGDAPLLGPATALGSMPLQRLEAADVRRIERGLEIDAAVGGAHAALLDEGGELLAVAERRGERWQPRVVLHGA